MPKVAEELTAVEIKRLPSLPGFHSVGGVTGLALNVKKSGAASWILRVKVGDKRKDIGMGSFPTVMLETARERARDAMPRWRPNFAARNTAITGCVVWSFTHFLESGQNSLLMSTPMIW
jgi:hypothetical protein